jgi:hypothetical protein
MGFGPVVLHQQWAVFSIWPEVCCQHRRGRALRAGQMSSHPHRLPAQRRSKCSRGKVSEQFNPPGSNWFTHVTMNGTLCADMGPVSISTPWVPDHDCTWLCAFPDEYATYAASKNRKPCGDIGERLQVKQDEFGRRLNAVPTGNLCRLQQAPATQHGTCTSEGTQTRTRTAHHHQPHPITSGQSDP